MKKCRKCLEEKELADFVKNKRSNDEYHWHCKTCVKEYNKANSNIFKNSYLKHREKRLLSGKLYIQNNQDKRRNRRLISRYGIDLMQYENMLTNQQNRCKICERNTKLFVDHCHKTGKVRGLLCSKCNQGIGLFNEDLEIINKEINYIQETK